MSHLKICDIRPKDQVKGIYFVKYISLQDARDGKKYINIILSDATGDLEGRIWHGGEQIVQKVSKGDFAHIDGKVNFFQGRRQMIISEIEKANAEKVNREDFIAKSKHSPDKMFDRLWEIVTGLNDVYIRTLLENVLSDHEIQRRLKLWQAGKTIHHAYQGGLLEHILSCTELALVLSKHYGANHNYVVAGTVLHDICKIYELTDGLDVDYTEEGKLVGHLVKALEVVDRFSYRIKNFPYQMKLHLKHILLSHHGEFAFGSPKVPSTSEAYLVHLIDLMDSKMNTLEAVKRSDNNVGHWSSYVKHMDRMVYKTELPFYENIIEDEEVSQPVASHTKTSTAPVPKEKNPREKDLKQNLGSLLQGFKVQGNGEK